MRDCFGDVGIGCGENTLHVREGVREVHVQSPRIVPDSTYLLLVGCWLVKGGRSVNLVQARPMFSSATDTTEGIRAAFWLCCAEGNHCQVLVGNV